MSRASGGARVVLFDLGGVLVDVDLDRSRRRWREASGLSNELFDDAFFESGLKARMDRDRLDTEDLELIVNRRIGPHLSGAGLGTRLRGEELVAIWNACIEPRAAMLALVGRVTRGVRVGVLSDTDPFHGAYIQSLPELEVAVDAWTFSFEVGRLKPDPAMYRTALARLEAEPAETLFIDDRPGNVEGALAVGIDAVACTSPADVEAALAARGLIGRAG